MNSFKGKMVEHFTGQMGLCLDSWRAADGWWLRVAILDGDQYFKCREDECRPVRPVQRPYLVWTNPNKQAVGMTA